jgi:YHS domain-containing protein
MRLLLRVIALMVAMYAALSMVRRLLMAFTPAGHVGPKPTGAITTEVGHLVKDPVCGTYIPQATAIQAANQFFCSDECRRKYLPSPSGRGI